MLAFCWSWPGDWEKRYKRIRGYWFWNGGGLRHLLHIGTRGSGKFQAGPVLNDTSRAWIHNHIVHKPKLKHLAKPAKWLSCVVSTYQYLSIDCMLSSCCARVSEWIYTLWFAQISTLKLVRDIIITDSQMHHTDKYSKLAPSFGQFGRMVECLFTN